MRVEVAATPASATASSARCGWPTPLRTARGRWLHSARSSTTQQAVAELEAHGVTVASSLEDVEVGTLLIRSHGVDPSVIQAAVDRASTSWTRPALS
jgi:hypothetical protein